MMNADRNVCRYFEAVDVLYSTNKFHIGCMQVCNDFLLMFPRRHVVKIPSLRTRFELVDWPDWDLVEKGPGFLELEKFLLGILDSCRSLESLYLSFVQVGSEALVIEMPLYPPKTYDIIRDSLTLVDQVVTWKSPVLRVEVGIPETYDPGFNYSRDYEGTKTWRESEHEGRGLYFSRGEYDNTGFG